MASKINVDHTRTGPAAERNSAETFVVGVGASAGAVEALRTLFSSLKSNSCAAFIVVADRTSHDDGGLVE